MICATLLSFFWRCYFFYTPPYISGLKLLTSDARGYWLLTSSSCKGCRRFGVKISGGVLQVWKKNLQMHAKALGLAMMLRCWSSATRYLHPLAAVSLVNSRGTLYRFIRSTDSIDFFIVNVFALIRAM